MVALNFKISAAFLELYPLQHASYGWKESALNGLQNNLKCKTMDGSYVCSIKVLMNKESSVCTDKVANIFIYKVF